MLPIRWHSFPEVEWAEGSKIDTNAKFPRIEFVPKWQLRRPFDIRAPVSFGCVAGVTQSWPGGGVACCPRECHTRCKTLGCRSHLSTLPGGKSPCCGGQSTSPCKINEDVGCVLPEYHWSDLLSGNVTIGTVNTKVGWNKWKDPGALKWNKSKKPHWNKSTAALRAAAAANAIGVTGEPPLSVSFP